MGRFLTQDPIGHNAGLNLYNYCDNNPVYNVDPDGKAAINLAPAIDTLRNIPNWYGSPNLSQMGIVASWWAYTFFTAKDGLEQGGEIRYDEVRGLFHIGSLTKTRHQQRSRINVTPGLTIAMFHTHPISGAPIIYDPLDDRTWRSGQVTGGAEKFSAGDVDIANRYNIVSFLGTSRKILRYEPETRTTDTIHEYKKEISGK